jgi:hypothetical protein
LEALDASPEKSVDIHDILGHQLGGGHWHGTYADSTSSALMSLPTI